MDTAVSHALLRRASDEVEPETLRLHRPGAIVAFGPQDHLAPGYRRAVEAARARGFAAIERLAGGRAAVFHEETIAFSWIRPDPQPRLHIRERFEEVAAIMAGAIRSLGIDARVGEVPGEYCPGAHSVNARGKTKLMGVGQRLVQRAGHVGGVVVVGGSERVRDVLLPVYEALELTWDPATAGSLRDEAPSVTWSDARAAILEAFANRYRLEDADISTESLDVARTLLPRHEVRQRLDDEQDVR
jgi:octanoyl-[GcvH]:protein N-octanoyltransferase